MSSEALGAGQRLASGPSDILAATAFDHELRAAPHLWPGLAMADLAHALALHQAGLIPDAARAPLFRALLETTSLDVGAVELDPRVGDVYNNRDRLLRDLAGPYAGYLHTGRARREATTIAWQLVCRESLIDLGLAVCSLLDSLCTVADQHVDTLMPDFTYLHRAHPTTLAHYLLGHAGPLERHQKRIVDALDLVDSSPAGSGSTNGSRLPIDREYLAELLGFGSVIRHTRDAMWAPDMTLDIVATCMQVMTSIDRLAEELQIWTTESFDFVELDDSQSRTSVVMPHKKNPYALTYLRGAARHALGMATGLSANLLTASGQPDNRTFAYLEAPGLLTDTSSASMLLSATLSGASFNVANMRRAASAGFTTSTEICDQLSLTGSLDNRTSHKVVGSAVRLALAAGRDELEWDDLLHGAAENDVELTLDRNELEALTDPDAVLANRVTSGGASREEVVAMATEFREATDRRRLAFEQHPSHGYVERLLERGAAVAEVPTRNREEEADGHDQS